MIVSKNLQVIYSSKFDICGKKPLIELEKLAVGYLGIPFSCPVTSKVLHCYKNQNIVNVKKIAKRLFPVFEQVKGVKLRYVISHDAGRESCFEISNHVEKKY